jgi:hypothetical protein
MSEPAEPRNPMERREGNMDEIVRSLSDRDLDAYEQWVQYRIRSLDSRPDTRTGYGSNAYIGYRLTLWQGRIDRVRAERKVAGSRETVAKSRSVKPKREPPPPPEPRIPLVDPLADGHPYRLEDVIRMIDAPKHRVLDLVSFIPPAQRTDDGRLTPLAAAAIGAMHAMRTSTKMTRNVGEVWRRILTGEAGAPQQWMLIRKPRKPPELIEPPYVVPASQARTGTAMVFDPLGFLERLAEAGEAPG